MGRLHLPRLERWILWIGVLLLVLMTLLRLGLYLGFPHQGNSLGDAMPAFWLGFRYDLRDVSIIGLLLLVLGSIRLLHPFNSTVGRRFWRVLLTLTAFVLLFFYIVDFAHYAYLLQRLNAGVLNYLEDTGISLRMVWESYPVIWMILGLLAGAAILVFLFFRGYYRIKRNRSTVGLRARRIWFAVFFLLLGFFIFGRFDQYPLRWSNAFELRSDYLANLALNPFETFFNTLRFRKSTFNEARVRSSFPDIARFLGLPLADSSRLNYTRHIRPVADSASIRPNIILVICESFSAYKSSMWGNPLNTTPFFDSLCRNGLFFDHCFTPSYGTARGVWATITGIPDVESSTSTASRNPLAVDQRTIINDFRGYQKYYFIGGSPSWANIRGLLMNNIDSLHLYEQENMNAPRLDVWGISDKNLFLQATGILAGSKEPFFSIIQTADNHRPYSIPEEDEGVFHPVQVSRDSLKAFGFDKLEELNAFRYTDFCFRTFFEAAEKQPWFRNTIFVFVGDHGIPGDAGKMFPEAWTHERLTAEHVPLLFYSPAYIAPRRVHRISSQIDILPTLAGICRIPYSNSTLGRDLLDPALTEQAAFIYDPDYGFIGTLNQDYYYREQLRHKKEELVPLVPDSLRNSLPPAEPARDSLQQLSRAIYETARYMLLNNSGPARK